MLYGDVKVIYKVMCSLVKQNVVLIWELLSCFILAPRYNLTMMMESVFSFLPYFSIVFLAKGKISKSISLFLSHIGPKRCWPIGLQDFKSNTSLEQSHEIVYFFYMLIPEIKS